MAYPQIILPAVPARIHDADANASRGEQSLPRFHLQTMDNSGIRLRHGSGDDSDITGGLKPVEQTLTPDSSRHSSVSGDSERGPSVKTAWRPFSRLSESEAAAKVKEKEDLRQLYGYNKFISEKPTNALKYPSGFPRLAAYTSDEDDRSIYRRFKYIHNRIILQLEVEITELEYDLADLDQADVIKQRDAIRDGKWEGAEFRLLCTKDNSTWDDTQRVLMRKICDKVKEYDQLVFNQAHYETLNPASERAHRDYFTISQDTRLGGRFGDFLLHQDDFVSSVRTRSSVVHLFIQYLMDKNPKNLLVRLLRRLLRPKHAPHQEDSNTHDEILPDLTYFSNLAYDSIATGILVSLCVGILLIPAYLLFLLPMNHPSMAIVASVFIVICSLFISATTDADPYKVFVGTATYAALVIMFLGNIGASCAAA